jgi:RNA polymerase sigma-70 factor (ECF subfamily)
MNRKAGDSVPVAAEDAAAETGDEDLMLRYAAGDAVAFELLYARHRTGLFRFILRQCSDRGIAEELFQDVWSNLIQARAGYRPDARFATWLYTLAHNRVVDWYRRRSKVVWLQFGADEYDAGSPAQLEEQVALRGAQPEVRAESKQLAARMLALLDELPPAQREAFLLHEEGGLSVAEIAAATQTEVETAKSRLRYAIAKLRLGLAEMR